MTTTLTNWAGNVTFAAAAVHRPATVDELQHAVAGAERVRALGTAHSFNRIADTSGDLVSVTGLPLRMELNPAAGSVTVSAGLRYGDLSAWLHVRGYALHNLGSLPHISVGGAIATGTHGSGDANGSLSTAVSALQLVTSDGEVRELRRGRDADFPGAVVALGCLGVVTSLTLDVVPTYAVSQVVLDHLPLDALLTHLDEVFARTYSVSVFTDWRAPVDTQVWLKQRVGAGPDVDVNLDWLGARPADGPRHPLPGMPTENCTEQLGVPGPWHTRLPHFRMDFTPSSGAELQSEYFVARAVGAEALHAVDGVREVVAPVLQISELRTVAADDLWLSPAAGRDSLAIHFTWVHDAAAVAPAVAAVEEALAPFAARPHWGKVSTTPPADVRDLYERVGDFRELRERLDPRGAFANELTDAYLGRA